jgi:NAD(P)-dependent dehydrogenase (short-subunit alcohol dehydrogenase family)
MPLRDRVIVIIGGTTGLGLSAARACIGAGAKVVAISHPGNEIEIAARALGPDAMVLPGDATDPATATNAITVALKTFGGFHGLYHVAGGSGRSKGDGPLHEMSDEGWQYTLQQNLTSVAWSNRAAARQFLTQASPGSVVNVSSVLAFSPAPKNFATHAYAAAKAAVIGLTHSAAAYYAPHNIRFNAIAPGLIETPMSQRAISDPVLQEYIRAKQPLDGGRIGQPADLDATVLYLLSDASKFVTGQVISVDGGWGVTNI